MSVLILFIFLCLYYKIHVCINVNENINTNNSLYYISDKYFNIYDSNDNTSSQWNKISICLFTSIHHGSQGYIATVLNNYDLFWPKNIGKKVILLDKGFEYLEAYITNNWNVYYEEYNLKGEIRKQYSFYVAYKYCRSNKYIAYMDSDSIFTMKISKFMLFDEINKPYFLYTNKIRNFRFNPLYILKFNITKWGDGMITFPVIVYTKHLIELDEYIEKMHNTTLEKVINKFFASQFCVILEYVKKYYKNEYHFSIYEENPILRCGLHVNYAYGVQKSKKLLFDFNSIVNSITYDGICSILNTIYPQKCKKFNITAFYNRFYLIDSFKVIKSTNYDIDKSKYKNLKNEILNIIHIKNPL